MDFWNFLDPFWGFILKIVLGIHDVRISWLLFGTKNLYMNGSYHCAYPQKLQIIIYLSRVQNSSSSKTILTLLELGLDLLKPTYPFLINNRFSDPIGIDLKMILHSKFTRFFTKAWQISLICIWNFLKKGL